MTAERRYCNGLGRMAAGTSLGVRYIVVRFYELGEMMNALFSCYLFLADFQIGLRWL